MRFKDALSAVKVAASTFRKCKQVVLLLYRKSIIYLLKVIDTRLVEGEIVSKVASEFDSMETDVKNEVIVRLFISSMESFCAFERTLKNAPC